MISKKYRLLIDREYIFGEKVIYEKKLQINNLKINKWFLFKGINIKLDVSKNGRDLSLNSSEIVDWSKLKNKRISIRNWKRGDAFIPLGLSKNQKLSDFFINNKINQFKKDRTPIMVANEEIIWVCGFRISDKIKVTKKNK